MKARITKLFHLSYLEPLIQGAHLKCLFKLFSNKLRLKLE